MNTPKQEVARPVQLHKLLSALVDNGGYYSALICTDEGLLVACTGDLPTSEELAGVVSLIEDVVIRAERDLGVSRVDEVTLLDQGRARVVIRPLLIDPLRFHLVVRLPPKKTWRRNTNRTVRAVSALLQGTA